MNFPVDYETSVRIDEGEFVAVQQIYDGGEESDTVRFTAHRARLVAREMLRLANEIDGLGDK